MVRQGRPERVAVGAGGMGRQQRHGREDNDNMAWQETYEDVIQHEGFTNDYTKVVATAPKTYNSYNHYAVRRVEDNSQVGFVHFQEGPIKECGVNGICNEDLILMIVDRLESFQSSEYNCDENIEAIEYLMKAIEVLRARTDRRVEEGTEGTSEV